jgi:Tfp pilus assembly protein PilV
MMFGNKSKNMKRSKNFSQRGALLLEVLVASLLLSVGGAIVIGYFAQHAKMLRNTKVKDTANYTASFAARQYKINYCSTGVVAANGVVIVSDQGIGIYPAPAQPTETNIHQTYRFTASSAYTPTGDDALNFTLLDSNGKSITSKIIAIN